MVSGSRWATAQCRRCRERASLKIFVNMGIEGKENLLSRKCFITQAAIATLICPESAQKQISVNKRWITKFGMTFQVVGTCESLVTGRASMRSFLLLHGDLSMALSVDAAIGVMNGKEAGAMGRFKKRRRFRSLGFSLSQTD